MLFLVDFLIEFLVDFWCVFFKGLFAGASGARQPPRENTEITKFGMRGRAQFAKRADHTVLDFSLNRECWKGSIKCVKVKVLCPPGPGRGAFRAGPRVRGGSAGPPGRVPCGSAGPRWVCGSA